MEYKQMTLAEWLDIKQKLKQDISSAKDKLNGLKKDFVRIGYLLRKIDDNELYKQDGYKSIAEFAKVICEQADFEYENADEINMILSSYSINGVSASFGSSWNVYTDKGVAMKRDTYALLSQTGLCCRLAR